MTKATYKREHLMVRLFIISEGKFMVILVGSLAARRQASRQAW